jgi:hypothetical protein
MPHRHCDQNGATWAVAAPPTHRLYGDGRPASTVASDAQCRVPSAPPVPRVHRRGFAAMAARPAYRRCVLTDAGPAARAGNAPARHRTSSRRGSAVRPRRLCGHASTFGPPRPRRAGHVGIRREVRHRSPRRQGILNWWMPVTGSQTCTPVSPTTRPAAAHRAWSRGHVRSSRTRRWPPGWLRFRRRSNNRISCSRVYVGMGPVPVTRSRCAREF